MMREGSLFTGYNGLGMAVSAVFGSEPAWFSEIEPGPCAILAHHWPDVPNLGDITTVDWNSVEPVDIVTGGFPCTDVSLAGKRAGMTPDTRSGLWTHMAYAIGKLRPRYVVAENVRGLLSATAHSDVEPCPWCLGDGPDQHPLRASGAVLGDLADLGYDVRWCGLRAADVEAPHGRYRIFFLARDTDRSDSDRRAASGLKGQAGPTAGFAEDADCSIGDEWRTAQDWRAGPDGRTAADSSGDRRYEGGPEPAGFVGGPDAALSGDAAANTWGGGRRNGADAQAGELDAQGGHRGPTLGRPGPIQWGQYAPAIERWERVLGRVAPAPTEPGAKGGQRLSPVFVEWLMGLPAGHITGVPGVNRNAQLKALGNGVVPQQAYAALMYLREAS